MKAQNTLSEKGGFTLVEIIVSLMILLISASGIITSFVVAKRYVALSTRRNVAANFARQQIEKLSAYVRQDTWTDNTPGSNLLYAPVGTKAYTTSVSGDFATVWLGTSSYTVTNTSNTAYRVVDVNVNWAEPTGP